VPPVPVVGFATVDSRNFSVLVAQLPAPASEIQVVMKVMPVITLFVMSRVLKLQMPTRLPVEAYAPWPARSLR